MNSDFFTPKKEKKRVQSEAVLDYMWSSRKEVIELIILRKKKSRIKITDFKTVDFNKLRTLRKKFSEKLVKESQLIPKEMILQA